MRRVVAATLLAAGALLTPGQPAGAAGTAATSFPPDFPVIVDASLNEPVLGFGGQEGPLARTPVILLHGNNDTSHQNDCNRVYGNVHRLAQFLLDHGYNPREVWGLGYQGDQCDLLTGNEPRASEAHTTLANVPDLRAFVGAVLAYTGASQVDIVGHSLGGTLTREWMRQDGAYAQVRRLVAILNSPEVWQLTFDFLSEPVADPNLRADRVPAARDPHAGSEGGAGRLPVTGGLPSLALPGMAAVAVLVSRGRGRGRRTGR